MTVTYAHSRVNQEIAKSGILPLSTFWASGWPVGAPTGGLFLHFIPSIIMITAIPFGDAYNFIIDIEGYARAVIFFTAGVGLFVLRYRPFQVNPYNIKHTTRPFKVLLPVAAFFLIAQCFVLVVPFLRPPGGKGDTSLPYWLYPLVGIGVMLFAGVYYAVLVWLMPMVGGYKLTYETVRLADGTYVRKFIRGG